MKSLPLLVVSAQAAARCPHADCGAVVLWYDSRHGSGAVGACAHFAGIEREPGTGEIFFVFV